MKKTLYLVATPIGNLEDITYRAITTLQTVDLIAAEDTRRTGLLLKHFNISTPQISYHDHNRQSRTTDLITKLQQGQAIALVTDAGMPTISDPGYELVTAAISQNIPIIPIPGPSAVITALSASGLPTDRFIFEGFLPVKGQERTNRLHQLKTESRTIILYESPHRLLTTLTDLAETLGFNRDIVIARELTKLYEEFIRGNLQTAIAHHQKHPPQGEFTLVIRGAIANPIQFSDSDLIIELTTLINQGLSRSDASRQLAQTTGLSKRYLYQLTLNI